MPKDKSAMTGHQHGLRIYYEDTDFSGVVYHASYLRFFERGRTEWLRAIGVDQSHLHKGEQPLAFAVRAMSLDFRKPARMDDWLMVETSLRAISGARLQLDQTIRRGEEILVAADVTIVAVQNGRAVRLPEALVQRLNQA
jgi:acyl-CoA thioester hydrolase